MTTTLEHPKSEFQGSERKVTNWDNEPNVRQLKGDLEMAKQAHDAHMAKITHWNDLMSIRGKAKPPKVKGRSSVQPKLIRRQAEWRYSALTEPFLGSDKLYSVKPITFEDTDGAKQNELVVNWQWRTKINRVKFIDDYVRSTVDEGTCIVRLGWTRVTTKVKETVPVYSFVAVQSEEEVQMLQQAIEAKMSDPRGFAESATPEMVEAVNYFEETQQPVIAIQTGTQVIDVDKVLLNHPTAEVMNPQNVVIDPSCNGDIDKALFVICSFETNKAELQKNPERYKNLDLVNWEGNSPLNQPDHETGTPQEFQFTDALRKKVVAYEYWGFYDINNDGNLVPIVATWIGDVIVRMELNPFPDEKLPFVVVPYLPVKRELYGETDAELLEDNQAILGAVSRGMIDLLGRSANSQQGFAKGMLDPLNRRRFDNGQDYEFNPNVSPANGLINHKYPELPQSALVMLNIQNQEAEALTGVKSFGGGISGEAYGDVAAGIRGVLDAASKREMAILRRLAKGMVEIGQKFSSMNAAFLSEEEVIRVTNEEFVTIKREDLKGNFDFSVDISTAEVDNAKAQDLSFMLQTLGNTVELPIVLMVLSEIAYLKRMPELAKRLEKYQPQPSPEQQMLQKLEIEKAQLENAKLESEVALNKAKAKAENSRADQADLDFVEQETGTKHARDLQKQGAQARGNQNLEVTKALAKPKKEGESDPDIEAAVGFNEFVDAENQRDLVQSAPERDMMAPVDPRFNIGSRFFDPSMDPALNPNINI